MQTQECSKSNFLCVEDAVLAATRVYGYTKKRIKADGIVVPILAKEGEFKNNVTGEIADSGEVVGVLIGDIGEDETCYLFRDFERIEDV